MKVVVAESLVGPAVARLAEHCQVDWQPDLWRDRQRLAAALADAHGLIVRNQTRVDAWLLAQAPQLLVVGRAGVGLDNVDVEAASRAGVVVCWTPEENAISVAEHVFALLLAVARRLVPYDASVRAGRWDRFAWTGIELYGRTLGLVGLGRIGFRVALRARAFGMRVIAYDPLVSPHAAAVTEAGCQLVPLEQLLAESDVVSLHVPLTPSTRHLLDAQRLALMKPGAILINTARGELVDEEALLRALQEGRLGGAGLDVRAQEPPQPSPLEQLPNVVLTPHVAALTAEAQARVTEAVVDDVLRVLAGQPARQAVNFSRPQRSSREPVPAPSRPG